MYGVYRWILSSVYHGSYERHPIERVTAWPNDLNVQLAMLVHKLDPQGN